MYIDFQQNRLCIDQSKPCTQIYLQKIANLCNLQLEFRKTKPFGHALPPHGH